MRKALKYSQSQTSCIGRQTVPLMPALSGVAKAAADMGYVVADVEDAFNTAGVNASCGSTPPTGNVLTKGNNGLRT